MGKKMVQEEQNLSAPEETFEGDDLSGGFPDDANGLAGLDFDVADEYKIPPLIPKGVYHATATAIKYEASQYAIVWDWCLHDNGGVMNDGETPVDGAHVYSRNWLPKPGDESIPTKSGKTNKRQSKINMMMDFQKELGIDMNTANAIAEALAEGQWIGVEADLKIGVSEYQGRFRNDVDGVTKSKMY